MESRERREIDFNARVVVTYLAGNLTRQTEGFFQWRDENEFAVFTTFTPEGSERCLVRIPTDRIVHVVEYLPPAPWRFPARSSKSRSIADAIPELSEVESLRQDQAHTATGGAE